MKVFYDSEVDALYIKFNDLEPEGVVEVEEGVNLDVTKDGKIVGMEILNASKKVGIDTVFNYSLILKDYETVDVGGKE